MDNMEESKPHFIFLKATEGTTHRDTRYKEYRKKAREKGIVTGAYHFFSYKTSGRDQAKNFLEFANLKKGDLPPVLDVEFTSNMPKASYIKQQIAEFLNYIEDETGVKPIIYCECDYYNKYLKSSLKADYDFWISDFWRQPRCEFTFWQKTDKFKHPAFKGTIDYNVFRGSLEDLKSFSIR